LDEMDRYSWRRFRNTTVVALSIGATVLGLGWLVLILGSLVYQGLSGLSPAVFTYMTPPPGSDGGLLNPILGSLILTFLAILIGTPIGILAGTYMAEYGKFSRLTIAVRFINDILLSAPSIVVGLFVYEIIVVPIGHFSGWAGAVALALIVVPVVVRTTEDMLSLVPKELRESAAALGLPRAHIVRHVCYQAARAGIITGVLLAIARISGETAPLLFTALNSQFSPSPDQFIPDWGQLAALPITQVPSAILHNVIQSADAILNGPIASLPVVIFQFAMSPYADWQKLAWIGALLITFAVLALSITARALSASRTSL
jgi:phosphate transport system permease protein